jgi:hypothetical protein
MSFHKTNTQQPNLKNCPLKKKKRHQLSTLWLLMHKTNTQQPNLKNCPLKKMTPAINTLAADECGAISEKFCCRR